MITAVQTWANTGRDVAALPEHVSLIKLSDQDILVVSVPDDTSPEGMQNMREYLKKRFPSLELLVMRTKNKLDVMKKSDLPAAIKTTTDGGVWGKSEEAEKLSKQIDSILQMKAMEDVVEAIKNFQPSVISKIWEPAIDESTKYCCMKCRQPLERHEIVTGWLCPFCGNIVTAYKDDGVVPF